MSRIHPVGDRCTRSLDDLLRVGVDEALQARHRFVSED